MRFRIVAVAVAVAVGSMVVPGTMSASAEEVIGSGPYKGMTKLDNGLYKMVLPDGHVSYTHGYDDVANHGSWSWINRSLKRQPICATDYYIHVLYGRLSSSSNQYNSRLPEILNAVKNTNYLLNMEGVESGGHNADFKVLCDGIGDVAVGSFAASSDDFSTVIQAARNAGYNRSNVKYWIFFDTPANTYAGISDLYNDESPSKSNLNNSGSMYSLTHRGYWDSRTPLHEIGHSMGAVQQSAPYSTGNGYHCWEDVDVMCYNDGGNRDPGSSADNCLDRIHFDCNHDTYFDTQTEPGEWLATHWNLGDTFNRFIAFDGNPLPPANRPPFADFSWQCNGNTCSFFENVYDLDGSIASRTWEFGDSTSTTSANPVHTYASSGTFSVKLTATDLEGASTSVTKTVGAYASDPDPASPSMTRNQRLNNRAVDTTGTWHYYKVIVNEQYPELKIDIGGPPCTAYWPCDAFLQRNLPNYGYPFGGVNLDLYIQNGSKPTLTSYACRSARADSAETCTISAPPGGILYIGVHTYWRYAQNYGWTYFVETKSPEFF